MTDQKELTTKWVLATGILLFFALVLPFPYMDLYRLRTGAEPFIHYVSLTEMITGLSTGILMAFFMLFGLLLNEKKPGWLVYGLAALFCLALVPGLLKPLWRSLSLFAGSIFLAAATAVMQGRLLKRVVVSRLASTLVHLALFLYVLSRIRLSNYVR